VDPRTPGVATADAGEVPATSTTFALCPGTGLIRCSARGNTTEHSVPCSVQGEIAAVDHPTLDVVGDTALREIGQSLK